MNVSMQQRRKVAPSSSQQRGGGRSSYCPSDEEGPAHADHASASRRGRSTGTRWRSWGAILLSCSLYEGYLFWGGGGGDYNYASSSSNTTGQARAVRSKASSITRDPVSDHRPPASGSSPSRTRPVPTKHEKDDGDGRAVASGSKTTALLSNLMKDQDEQQQQQTSTREARGAAAAGVESLFWSPQFHGPLPPIGDVGRPKYNDLELWKRRDDDQNNKGASFERTLLSYDRDEKIYSTEKEQQLRVMDQRSVSPKWERFEERDYTSQDECVRPAWTDLQFPVCNAFHELQTETVVRNDWRVRYLASGYYRDSFLLEKEPEEEDSEAFVWKRIRWKDSFRYDFGLSEQIRTEALVMERLSASPRTTHIYGYCATSLAVEVAHDITEDIVPYTTHQKERGRISQEKLEELQRRHKAPIFSFNNYTVTEKLDLSIAVAEAIAEMHGFDSVIANDDVHPDQWLVAGRRRDGDRLRLDDIRLNDMNNARFLQYNPEKQQYCKVWSSYGGDFRAPEEYVGAHIDESVDIYPMANMIFSILTGLWPWYEIPRKRREDLQEKAIAGKRPFLNPLYLTNSLIEGRLVELMDMCYALKPSNRPNIFQVVRHLHQTKAMHLEQQQKDEKEKR